MKCYIYPAEETHVAVQRSISNKHCEDHSHFRNIGLWKTAETKDGWMQFVTIVDSL
jgi:hypothetical protein